MSNFLIENFDFHAHLSTFRAENIPKNRPSKGENNAQTLHKQLRKSPENDFLAPKIVKNDPSKRPK